MNWEKVAGGLGAGAAYKGFNSFIHPEEAYELAQKKENEGYGQAQNYLQNYNQHGQDQYNRLNQGANDLMDPNFYSKLAAGYNTSPYAQQQLSQNLTQGQDIASSMGLGGSSAALGDIQQGAGNILQKDRQTYLDNIMKNYMAGIGIGQNLYGIGANAAGQQSSQGMTHAGNQAGLEYGAQAAPGKLFGQIAGTALNYAMPGAGLGNTFTGQGQMYGAGNQYNR